MSSRLTFLYLVIQAEDHAKMNMRVMNMLGSSASITKYSQVKRELIKADIRHLHDPK